MLQVITQKLLVLNILQIPCQHNFYSILNNFTLHSIMKNERIEIIFTIKCSFNIKDNKG